jgi:pimeloyl-ACP methyl ester carboxylesterase
LDFACEISHPNFCYHKHMQELQDFFTVTEHGTQNNKVLFVFGAWKSKTVMYKPLLKDLAKRGYQCILYVPRSDLIAINVPYAEIVTASHLAVDDVTARLKHLRKEQVQSFGTLGVSLGTIFAMQSAKFHPEIEKVLLLAPYGDFAEHVKRWATHRYYGKILRSQPTSQEASGDVLNQVALHTDLELLHNKHVLLCYANRDNSTHTEVAERMLQEFRQHNISVEAVKVHGGHITGIFKNLYINKVYAEFLDS